MYFKSSAGSLISMSCSRKQTCGSTWLSCFKMLFVAWMGHLRWMIVGTNIHCESSHLLHMLLLGLFQAVEKWCSQQHGLQARCLKAEAFSLASCYDMQFISFSFLYLTSCITTAVTWLTLLPSLIVSVHLWLILTHYQYAVVTQYWYSLFLDSLWLSTILWLIMSHLLIVLWLLSKWCYCPSDSYCSHDSLFSNTISTSVFGP